jgi:hypothetical protein
VAERFGLKGPLFFDASVNRHRSADELSAQLKMAGLSDDASNFTPAS